MMPCLTDLPTGLIIDPDAGKDGDGTIYISSIVTGKSLAKITTSSQDGEPLDSGSFGVICPYSQTGCNIGRRNNLKDHEKRKH